MNERQPVTGSFTISSNSLAQQKQQHQKHNLPDDSLKSILKPSRVLTTSTSESSECEYAPQSELLVSETIAQTGYTPNNETQISTSITNIGNAVLRSKTAGFEKMLYQNKKQQLAPSVRRSSNGGGTGGRSDNSNGKGSQIIHSTVATSNITSGNTTTSQADNDRIEHILETSKDNVAGTSSSSDVERKRPGPIYKRQQIISSVRNSKK